MINQSYKSYNAPVAYPTMHHSEQKCSHFCSEWCIVGYGTGALWDLWIRSIGILLLRNVLSRMCICDSSGTNSVRRSGCCMQLQTMHCSCPVSVLLVQTARHPGSSVQVTNTAKPLRQVDAIQVNDVDCFKTSVISLKVVVPHVYNIITNIRPIRKLKPISTDGNIVTTNE